MFPRQQRFFFCVTVALRRASSPSGGPRVPEPPPMSEQQTQKKHVYWNSQSSSINTDMHAPTAATARPPHPHLCMPAGHRSMLLNDVRSRAQGHRSRGACARQGRASEGLKRLAERARCRASAGLAKAPLPAGDGPNERGARRARGLRERSERASGASAPREGAESSQGSPASHFGDRVGQRAILMERLARLSRPFCWPSGALSHVLCGLLFSVGNVHISGPQRFKNTTKIQRKDPQEREEKKKIVAGEGKKKNAKIWCSHPSGLHPSGLHPSGHHFF